MNENIGVPAVAGPLVAGHTPGPWRIDQNQSDIWIGPHINGGPDVLAIVHFPIGSWTGSALQQRIADGRLIAAAPELLRELKKLAAFVGNMSFHPKAESDHADALIETAYAVIAKAEDR